MGGEEGGVEGAEVVSGGARGKEAEEVKEARVNAIKKEEGALIRVVEAI